MTAIPQISEENINSPVKRTHKDIHFFLPTSQSNLSETSSPPEIQKKLLGG
jgi:hypothetical protein